ncbi:MAG: 3-hydroxyacyl-ACP dehydratase FabZ [Acidobacteria bacterium]|nr:3-hydroxyacyl-ACP dehydratase FabZ [Acidobacteriota bacterium]MCZ6746461.1 3-hydroxyacyl-ACP dehydratase FabZ [Acidobacteriota bacterium]
MIDVEPGVSNIDQILKIIPHRYPFLLVDRILECEKNVRAVGIKCVTANEPFFPGHFPGHPVMPGVLIIEAMAQVGAILMLCTRPDRDQKLVYFTGIDHAKFRRPVVPGDVLTMTLTVKRLRAKVCRMHGEATVDGKLAAEADIMSAIVDR